jgi:hypothetical protein
MPQSGSESADFIEIGQHPSKICERSPTFPWIDKKKNPDPLCGKTTNSKKCPSFPMKTRGYSSLLIEIRGFDPGQR